MCLTIRSKKGWGGFCEHAHETQASTKVGEFIEHVTNSQVLKKVSASIS